MTRPCLRGVAVALCLAAASTVFGACSTYRDDLDRATAHYNANQYEAALALFEVLERDTDSLPPKERAQYAYYRGMTHFRLKRKLDARHWLGVALASEKQQSGSLEPDQIKLANETIEPLNKERYGLADNTPLGGLPCKSDTDCGKDQLCDQGKCAAAPGAPSAAAAPGGSSAPAAGPKAAACKADGDCPPEKVCDKGTCIYR